MEMGDSFATVWSVVYDDSIAIGKFFKSGDFSGRKQKVAEKRAIGLGSGPDALEGFFWNNQNMHGSLRSDVSKGEALVILEDDVGGNLASDDFFEKRHARRRLSSSLRRD